MNQYNGSNRINKFIFECNGMMGGEKAHAGEKAFLENSGLTIRDAKFEAMFLF